MRLVFPVSELFKRPRVPIWTRKGALIRINTTDANDKTGTRVSRLESDDKLTSAISYPRQDRPRGAKCLTNGRLRLIFWTGPKPTKSLGFVLIQNPTADSGTLTKLDADRL